MADFFDREFLKSPNLADWLKSFADQEIKSGNGYSGIQNLLQKKNDLDAVEARVKEMRERVGLDQLEDQIKIADRKKEAKMYGLEKVLSKENLEKLKSKKIKQFHALTDMFKKTVEGDPEHTKMLNEVVADLALIEEMLYEIREQEFAQMQEAKDEQIPGGLSSGKEDDDYNKKQLQTGIKIEKEEHTDGKTETDNEIATEITKDHLQEHPFYYSFLTDMEKEMEQNKESKAAFVKHLIAKANHYDRLGKVKEAKRIDFLIYKFSEDLKKKSWKDNEKIQKIIEKVVKSRGGYVDFPVVLDIISKEIPDIVLSQEEKKEMMDYIKEYIKENKKPVRDDNNLEGIGVVIMTTDSDLKDDVSKPR